MIDDAEPNTRRDPIEAARRFVAEEPRGPRSSPTPASGGWSAAVMVR